MVVYNYQDREITGKIVYYGPSSVGKSTSLRHIYERVDEEARGKMLQMATDEGRVLQFDFLPVNVGEITGMKIRFQLVTAPGQVNIETGWRRVLQGADAVVFVADSDPQGLQDNREAYEMLIETLESAGVDTERIPLIFQLNKRDLGSAASVEQINQELNLRRVPWFASSAIQGEGVLETFQTIGRMLLVDIGRRYKEELLRKKREQIQRSQAPLAFQSSEAAEPEEETRAIRLQEASEAHRLSERPSDVDEAPTRLVEPPAEEKLPQPPSPPPPVSIAPPIPVPPPVQTPPPVPTPPPFQVPVQLPHSSPREEMDDEPVPTPPSVEPLPASFPPTIILPDVLASEPVSGNGRLSIHTADPSTTEDVKPTTADLRVETPPQPTAAPVASTSVAIAPAVSTEIRALRTELGQLSEQSLRLLETQSALLRRIEELRLRIDRLEQKD